MNSEDKAYIDALLTYWGRWARSRIISGHGYSSESVEYRLMRDGMISSSTDNHIEPSDDIAESVESIIVQMPTKMKKVVKIEYIVYASRKHKQEICRLGRRQYEDLLTRGRNWVLMEFDKCSLDI